jgi:hypothetical protein
VLGWEGFWGTAFMAILGLPLAWLIPGADIGAPPALAITQAHAADSPSSECCITLRKTLKTLILKMKMKGNENENEMNE